MTVLVVVWNVYRFCMYLYLCFRQFLGRAHEFQPAATEGTFGQPAAPGGTFGWND